MTTTTLLPFAVPSRFSAAPGVAHSGWLAGRLASHLVPDGIGLPAPPVSVTLRAPTPVDRALAVDHTAHGVRLLDGEQVLADARFADSCPLPPAEVDWARAAQAEAAYVGWWDHPFVDCFACGTRGDGLRLCPGPVDDRPGLVATRWAAPSDDPALLWAALSCPTSWRDHAPTRLTTQVHRLVSAGDDLLVVAQPTRCAIYTRDHHLVAAGWVEAR